MLYFSTDGCINKLLTYLLNSTAARCVICRWCDTVVRLSVCNSVRCFAQGQCRGLKVVPLCS